jgi:hypothetical protein
VIHKNYYYRDSEKYRMVERIATLHDQLERHLRAREQDEEGVDLVLQNGFRKVRWRCCLLCSSLLLRR